jgi:hypothetical protein
MTWPGFNGLDLHVVDRIVAIRALAPIPGRNPRTQC